MSGVFGLLPIAPWLAAAMQAPASQACQVQQPLDWFLYPYRQAHCRNRLVACTASAGRNSHFGRARPGGGFCMRRARLNTASRHPIALRLHLPGLAGPYIAIQSLPSSLSSQCGEGSTEVVLVRHGETSLNVSGVIQGQMDPELNEAGRQQALMVARRLSGEAKPAAVYSSDLKRAAETAQMIATACGVPDLVLDRALRDRHMGDLQGLRVDDFAAGQSNLYKALRSYERKQEIPGGGETLDQLSQRCVLYLNTVAEKHKGERVIVVSHGAVIEEICIHADPTSSVREKIDNTSISIIHISGDNRHWILDKVGDVSHLT